MLACARIGAPHTVVFGGFAPTAVRERLEVSRAKALIVADGARRKGKFIPVKQQVDEVISDLPDLETVVVVRSDRRRMRDAARTGRVVRRPDRQRRPGLPGRADGGRAPAVPALLLRLHGQAQGNPAHHGRLPHRGHHHHRDGLRPRPRARRLLVHGRRGLDHRPFLHRLRPAGQRLHVGDVRGRPGLPGQGHLVGDRRAVRRDDLLHRADRHPGLHEVGGGLPGQARPVVAAAARHGRRADQPQGLAVVLRRHRRRALPDRGHLVADGDRRHHDHHPARPDPRQAGIGRPPAARRVGRPGGRVGCRDRATAAACSR